MHQITTAAAQLRARERGATKRELEALYRWRYADFLRTATAITGSVEDGRDAVQDAFVSLVTHRRGFSGRGSFDAWVWRAVVNAARKHRRRRPIEVASLDEFVEAPSGNPSSVDLTHLRTAISRLPERQRLALFLHYYADLDYRSIAEVLEVRSGTVAATLHAAKRSLQERLDEEDQK
jgi:RNA polymerase sigma-70 factor, ECF subfamily